MPARLIALAALFALPVAAAEPDVNAGVAKFCQERLGETIGNGGCEAVAAESFAAAGAAVGAGEARWGERVTRLEEIRPGDVVVFRGAQLLVRARNGTKHLRTAESHVAVVARNLGGGRFDVYEQNVVAPGRNKNRATLRRGYLDLTGLLRGEVTFHRPAAE